MSGSKGKIEQLVVVLGDQLSLDISSLAQADRSKAVVLMCEVATEATYVPHHKQKMVLVFAAMRKFAAMLRARGWRVRYVTIEDAGADSSFTSQVEEAVRERDPARIIVTFPGEWRVLAETKRWERQFNRPVDIIDDTRFVCPPDVFRSWASERKSLRMEYFYRLMRKRTGLLMDGDEPAGGRWNFDADNRNRLPADVQPPDRLRFEPDKIVREVMRLVAARFPRHFGSVETFAYATTAEEAEIAFQYFLTHSLASFGAYQDAMTSKHGFVFHAIISPYLNNGLLDPLDVCRRVEQAWREGKVPLNAAEGFIRQIIGWREYVRGIYWLKMPGYATSNALGHREPLPAIYWSGQSQMACMRSVIGQTMDYAYAHHIQRLMVTGNFALLLGVEPQQVHEWYLAVYADAYEWVEMPNTLGMSQFADGGLLGSKPYVSSGAYINRMSDYCRGCIYDVKTATEPASCPFNALYWDFMDRHEDRLGRNPRLMQPYRLLEAMAPEKRKAIKTRADAIRAALRETGDAPL